MRMATAVDERELDDVEEADGSEELSRSPMRIELMTFRIRGL